MKKVISTILLIFILIAFLGNCKVIAYDNETIIKKETISVPAKIEHKLGDNDTSSGIDTVTGIIIEPLTEFITIVVDAILEVTSSFMTQEPFGLVMTENPIYDETNVGAEITIDNVDDYKNAFGFIDVKYPNFNYSPEEIFSGQVEFLNINFFRKVTDNTTPWAKIRSTVVAWYKAIRMIAIVALLSVLIYIGIKIILSANSTEKAKYKEMLISWFIAVVLLFTMQYIMSFIVNVIEQISQMLKGVTGNIKVNFNGETFTTNLIGLARFKMQQQQFSSKLGYFMLYIGLVVFTFKFTFVYLKRLLVMVFLTLIAPIVAITYPIEKAQDGKAQGFNLWLKEYTYNMLLQPMHYILYYILISTSLTLAADNLIYALAVFAFMSEAEKLLKRIFGFGKARLGTVGGVAGAFATGALTSSLNRMLRKPLHNSGKISGPGNRNEDYGTDEMPKPIIDDIEVENFIPVTNGQINDEDFSSNAGSNKNDGDSENNNSEEDTESYSNYNNKERVNYRPYNSSSEKKPVIDNGAKNDEIEENGVEDDGTKDDEAENNEVKENGAENKGTGYNIVVGNEVSTKSKDSELEAGGFENLIAKYRKDLSQKELDLIFKDGDERSLEEILDIIARENNKSVKAKNKEREKLIEEILNYKGFAKNRILANEYTLTANGLPLQYIDGDNRSSQEIMNDIISNKTLFLNENTSESEKEEYKQYIEKDLKILNRRMAENNYIRDNNIVDKALQEHLGTNAKTTYPNSLENKDNAKIKNTPFVKGMANVGRTLVKPVWDTKKDFKYNAPRLVKKVAQGAVGVSVGAVATATQAAISLTDGKYSVTEGAATFGAGFVAGQQMVKSATELATGGEDETMQQYQETWYNRDDIISKYTREYPDREKAMRKRARDHYVARGIVDFNEQKQAMKFADQMLKEGRVKNIEEADRLAAATLNYKQNLLMNGNYIILYDKDKRNKYLQSRVKSYMGSASNDSVIKTHTDFINNVKRFDEINN